MTIPREALACRKCGRTNVELRTESGRKGWCKDCIRAYYAGYRSTHRSETNQRMREWRKTHLEQTREYARTHGVKAYWENPELFRQRAIGHRRKLKDQVYAAYGGYVCSCCGETVPEFLTIDHINNDGAEHRKFIGRCGNNLLQWLRKHNFPPGFQILCWNCQWGKNLAGTCPHRRTRND